MKKNWLRLTGVGLVMTFLITEAGCALEMPPAQQAGASAASAEVSAETAAEAAEIAHAAAETPEKPAVDRSGRKISIPEDPGRVISMAPATTQVLEALGCLDLLVGTDTQTPLYVEGLDGLPQFDMMEPDVEAIAALEPDLIFTTGMSYIEGDPYAALNDLGFCVVVIPSAESLAGIAEDIRFTARCLGREEAAESVVSEMEEAAERFREIGETIGEEERKSVLFEISALPYIYSFGSGTFLDEMLGIIGAENVFADEAGWLSVAEEDAVFADPDVIMTSVNYLEDPVGEILSRPGWESVAAVKNGEVYQIDNASSSLPNQHVIRALCEMALDVYPEVYGEHPELFEAYPDVYEAFREREEAENAA